ncbi:hypothetical protein ZYGR_0E00590 [Zygosaccharomyces rouxii]|uniref:Transcription factor BYE1 n=2 Tax=Zygosaccharomyces rouxii TaxID=4956 RepID=C5DQL9_ZYGRC|nr:uncharacterized protein ZYRO0B01386g [Zygosaccharomyces rouxii]KAH9200368.1 transcription factor S-II, central domain-containing protein [Zygosaccharomyces rouxii]GAV47048.1 hypothetical protein ZYGR_0E00590 [Zygosaccharomyces rouxii]CAR26080.1 ZYRO0B01386p [Zygosaccharomyces rouxii]
MSVRTSGRSNKGHNKYIQRILEEEKGSGNSGGNESDDSVRCPVCRTFDYNYDANEDTHGDMVQCDGCNTWQHIECMSDGKGMDSLLDSDGKYHCERCKPENYQNAKWLTKEQEQNPESNDYDNDNYLSESDSEAESVRAPRKRRKTHGSVSGKSGTEPKGSAGSTTGGSSGDARLRENAQKMLHQLFDKYIIPATVEAKLYALPDDQDDEKDIALEKSQELERELYNVYPDHRNYTERIRTIFSNLKDAKNLSLKAHVIKGQITTSQLVRMSATELANPDLQEFREKIDEQALTQLVVEQPGRPRWVKTHKGEELIENPEENNNGGDLEPDIFTREIVHREETAVKEPSPTPEKSVSPGPPPVRINVKYPELAIELSGTIDYIGSSSELVKNPYREALGDGKLLVEGRLSKAKVLKYLSEMQSTRTFLLYRIRPDENCNSEFKQVYEFLWENEKISGIQIKRSYQKNIYLIPSFGYDHHVIKDIAMAAGEFDREADNPILFLLTVIKPELVR